MQLKELTIKLTKLLGQKVELCLKKNRRSFLKLIPNRSFLKIILHPFFLEASEPELLAMKEFFFQRSAAAKKKLKIFCQRQSKKNLVLPKLKWEGAYYNLQTVLDDLNQSYFQTRLSHLKISWGRRCHYRKFHHLTFGSFDHDLKLIRINPILDHPSIPSFFLSFVVYHEMLHDLHPIIRGQKRQILHSQVFLEAEKKFIFYQEAKAFRKVFFKKREGIYGRA